MSLGDEFIGKTFGESGQVKVLGWFGELVGSNKKYTVECSICKSDSELFGDGKFLITKNRLLIGSIPCGCSLSPRWSKEQYEIKIKRLCQEDGFKFIGWDGEYNSRNSKINVECPEHGVLEGKSLSDFLAGRRCIECRRDDLKFSLRIPDEEVIDGFFSTNTFHPNTKFWRSDRQVPHSRYRAGYKPYWNVVCGECGEQSETLYSVLKSGGSSCRCFQHKQKLAYINLVYDSGNLIAIKFGITSKLNGRREREQNKRSVFEIKHLATWEFSSVSACKKAEKEIKAVLQTSVISKELMKDGWTETCWPHEIDKVIKIYEDFGGIRL